MFATLEIELPKSCRECNLRVGGVVGCYYCAPMSNDTSINSDVGKYTESRAPYCPLKVLPLCAQSIRRTVAAGEEKCIGKKYWVSVSAPSLIIEEGESRPICQKCEGSKGVEYASDS
jgi:hypothetical protein